MACPGAGPGGRTPAGISGWLSGALVAEALDDADWVVATRHGTGSPGPFRRRVGAAMLRGALRWGTGIAVTDPTSGLQALTPAAMRCFVDDLPDEAPDTGARVLAARAGLRYAEVPVWMPERGFSSCNIICSCVARTGVDYQYLVSYHIYYLLILNYFQNHHQNSYPLILTLVVKG